MDYFIFAEGWRGWMSALAGMFVVPIVALAVACAVWLASHAFGLLAFALTH